MEREFFYHLFFCGGLLSDQAQSFEFPCHAVLRHSRADAVAELFQVVRAIGHADADAYHIGHLQVIVAVAKADGIGQRTPQLIADGLDAGALVELTVDELPVDDG